MRSLCRSEPVRAGLARYGRRVMTDFSEIVTTDSEVVGSIRDLTKRSDEIGSSPWVVTSRSSPGWRIETYEGGLVGFGPGDVHDSEHARWLVDARNLLPELLDHTNLNREKINDLLNKVVSLDVENQGLYERNKELSNAVSEIHEYLIEFEMPDYFVTLCEGLGV